MNTSEQDAHLLIVEAKKHKTSGHDIDKVKGFMADSGYFYKYGLTISYAYDPKQVNAVLYYKTDNKILQENIEVERKDIKS